MEIQKKTLCKDQLHFEKPEANAPTCSSTTSHHSLYARVNAKLKMSAMSLLSDITSFFFFFQIFSCQSANEIMMTGVRICVCVCACVHVCVLCNLKERLWRKSHLFCQLILQFLLWLLIYSFIFSRPVTKSKKNGHLWNQPLDFLIYFLSFNIHFRVRGTATCFGNTSHSPSCFHSTYNFEMWCNFLHWGGGETLFYQTENKRNRYLQYI